jgi:hypothetical protein
MNAYLPYGTIVVPEPDTRSQWLRDTLAARAADAAKGVIIRTVNAKVKAPILRTKPRVSKPQKSQRTVRTKFCSECTKPLNKSNKSGLCKPHFNKQRNAAKRVPRPACKSCGATMNRNNTYGLCTTCSKPLFNKRTKQRRKARELQVSKAA